MFHYPINTTTTSLYTPFLLAICPACPRLHCASQGHTLPAATTLPATCPATAPRQQGVGHTCQGLSQSRGRGKAPNQAPSTVIIQMRNMVEVRGEVEWLE